MRVHGNLKRSGAWWEVEIPTLGIHTQGRSRKDALRMIADAIESLVHKRGLHVDLCLIAHDAFTVGSEDSGTWLPFVLRRMRTTAGLSLADVQKRLGARSKNAYARYEQGVSEPTLSKLEELLRVVAPSAQLIVTDAA